MINITNLIPGLKHVWKAVRTQDFNEEVYVLPPNQLNKILNKIDFDKMKKDLINQIAYELLEFEQSNINITKPLMKYDHFKDEKEIQDFLRKLKDRNQVNGYMNDYDFQLSVQLITNPDNRQLLEAEYYQINKRFNISQYAIQSPICIVGTQYNLYSRNQYKKFFQSMERQNYTNFHIVYIDDNSPDGSAYKIYDYLRNTNMKIKSRTKIIHTLQSVGAVGNMILAVEKLCNQNQIVVNIDLDDYVIGAQVLKVINKNYESNNTWYLYTRYLYPSQKTYNIGFSSDYLYVNTSEYRRSSTFVTSHLKTFRVKLHRATPIYQFVQYHYNIKTGMGWPTTPILATDLPHVYTLFELAGNDRVKYINYFAYMYEGSAASTRKCYTLHERYDARRWFLRIPLKKLNSLQQKAQQVQNDKFPEQILENTIRVNQDLVKCLRL